MRLNCIYSLTGQINMCANSAIALALKKKIQYNKKIIITGKNQTKSKNKEKNNAYTYTISSTVDKTKQKN